MTKPRVKPLVWDDFDNRGAKASAFYEASYIIQRWHSEGRYEVSLSYPGYQAGYDGARWHDTIEAAKAAAQADYEARILAALASQPALEPVQKLHDLPATEPRDVRDAAIREAFMAGYRTASTWHSEVLTKEDAWGNYLALLTKEARI